MALIRISVVPNCSQRLSWPILWIVVVCATYWTHTTVVCLLMVALARLWLPTHPHHPPTHPLHPPTPTTNPPPPPTHPLIRAICDITVAVKKVTQKPAVLAS